MKLTINQIDILIQACFTAEEESPPGLAEISRRLLSAGECIVAGTGRLWNGGVGNFIRVTATEDAVGCVKLTLDRESLLSSLWVREILGMSVGPLRDQVVKLQEQVDAVCDLINLASELHPEP